VVDEGHLVLRRHGVGLGDLKRIGRRLAAALRPGDLVLLYGPLGAGKTTLVREVAVALGVTDPVRSPSFTLANIYAGRPPVQHLDLYRLDAPDWRRAVERGMPWSRQL
jgi:tRNA threonylcarbamoyladenosine biosynthesis protein TsaE